MEVGGVGGAEKEAGVRIWILELGRVIMVVVIVDDEEG